MINNLEEKLDGKLPITRKELIYLINSWGRKKDIDFFTHDDIEIVTCESNQCYDLSNLDVSKINDLGNIFRGSLYNGDLSKWEMSSVKFLNQTFSFSEFNNNSISNWNISNVENMNLMFSNSKFDKNISNWNFNKSISSYNMFQDNKNFENKYNDGKELPYETKDFLEWFESNKFKISNLNVSKEEILEFDDYLSIFDEKELKNDKS